MPHLGVNIDHVGTLRQARRENEPDPILAAQICQKAGADSIVCHLREDRRHIHDADVAALKRIVKIRFNLEMSLNPKIVKIAAKIKPDQVTLVPERREELTTEGGLDVDRHFNRVRDVVKLFKNKGIEVSLFIAPVQKQIERSYQVGARVIELHTGEYAGAKTKAIEAREFRKIKTATQYARDLGFTVSAGHGLKYHNTKPIAAIDGMHELNIGHSIISRSIFVGLEQAVKEMRELVK